MLYIYICFFLLQPRRVVSDAFVLGCGVRTGVQSVAAWMQGGPSMKYREADLSASSPPPRSSQVAEGSSYA